jgi:hypothetical protein
LLITFWHSDAEGASVRHKGNSVNSTVKADARFLRRIFLGLVLLTLLAGGMAGFTAVQATMTPIAAGPDF